MGINRKIKIEVDPDKRLIVCYTSGEIPNLQQRYFVVNYGAEEMLPAVMDDIDNMMDDIVRRSTPKIASIQLPSENEVRDKATIKAEIDSLLEELKKI